MITLRIISETDTKGRIVAPKAQARPRFGGRRAYSPKTSWYTLVKWEAMKAAPAVPFDGPLQLEVVFIFPRPKSYPKTQNYKWTKPDGDNLVKAVKDALTSAAWWTDDGRVSRCLIEKRYTTGAEQPGAIITMFQLQDPAWKVTQAVKARPLPPKDEAPRLCWSCHADQWGCTVYPNGCCPDCDHAATATACPCRPGAPCRACE